ncbi:MAG: hypothetical protein Q8R76_13140, partial [Candidatus Omnitrophota bacterium]|nr:hypothetical protein [Candidatus Omnitrophota bacterium]
MYEAWHIGSKPWFIKAIAIVVVVTFLSTSVDANLAYANNPTAPATPVVALPGGAEDKQDLSDIHYMQGFDEGPLSRPSQETISPEAVDDRKYEDVELPESQLKIFMEITPLSEKARRQGKLEALENKNDGTTTFYNDETGAYFTVSNSTSDIFEIGDFTNANYPDEIEQRIFNRMTDEQGRNIVRIETVSLDENKFDTFHDYSENADGNLENLMASGIVVKDGGAGSFVRVTGYDYENELVTWEDPLNASAWDVHEMTEYGEKGRLLEHNTDEVSVTFRYDDVKQEMHFIDRMTNTNYIYALMDGEKPGALLRAETLGKDGLEVKDGFNVELTHRRQKGKDLETYRFSKADDPNFVVERLRLEGGGVGPLVYFEMRDDKEQYQQEFVYGEDGKSLTVMDYARGRFVRFDDLADAIWTGEGFLDTSSPLTESGIIRNATIPQLEITMTREGESFVVREQDGSILTYTAEPRNTLGNLIRLRGPPENVDQPVDFVFKYDPVMETRTSFNLSTQTYFTATYQNEQLGSLINRGTFTLSPDGSIQEEKVVETYGELEKIQDKEEEKLEFVYTYDGHESRSMEYALTLLMQENVSVGVVVESFKSADIASLLEAEEEVMIGVYKGQYVFAKSGDPQEIFLWDPALELTKDFELLAHIQPVGKDATRPVSKQDGPSELDFAQADKTNLEAVITSQGVFWYNRSGVKEHQEDFETFVARMATAKEKSAVRGEKGEYLANMQLGQFVASMDIVREAAPMEVHTFRSGAPTAEQVQAFQKAEAALFDHLGTAVPASKFLRMSADVNGADPFYHVTLRYGNTDYTYLNVDRTAAPPAPAPDSTAGISVLEEAWSWATSDLQDDLTVQGRNFRRIGLVKKGDSPETYEVTLRYPHRDYRYTVDIDGDTVTRVTELLTAEEEALFWAEQDLEDDLSVDRDEFERRSVTKIGTDTYEVVLRYPDFDYKYTIDVLSDSFTALRVDTALTPEEEAYFWAEADLERELETDRDNFTETSVTNTGPNTYDVIIEFFGKAFHYTVDVSTNTAILTESVSRNVKKDTTANETTVSFNIGNETIKVDVYDGTQTGEQTNTLAQKSSTAQDYSTTDRVTAVDLLEDRYITYFYDSVDRERQEPLAAGFIDENGNRVQDTYYEYLPGDVVRVVRQKDGEDDEYTDYEYDPLAFTLNEGKPLSAGTLIGDNVNNPNETTIYDYAVNPGNVRVVKKKAGEDDEYTDFAFNETDDRIEEPLDSGTLIGDVITATNPTTLYDYTARPGDVRVIEKKDGEDDAYTDFTFDETTRVIGQPLESGTLIGDSPTNTDPGTIYDYAVNPGHVRVITKKAGEDDEYTDFVVDPNSKEILEPVESGTLIGDVITATNPTTVYDYDVRAGHVRVIEKKAGEDDEYTDFVYDANKHEIQEPVDAGTLAGDVITNKNIATIYDYVVRPGDVRVVDFIAGEDDRYADFAFNETTRDIEEPLESGTLIGDVITNTNQEVYYDYAVNPGHVRVVTRKAGDDEYTDMVFNSVTRQIEEPVEAGTLTGDVITNTVVTRTYDYAVRAGYVRVIEKKGGEDDEFTDYVFNEDTRQIEEPDQAGTLIGDVVTATNVTTTYDYTVNPGYVRVVEINATGDDRYTDYEYDAVNKTIGRAVEGGTLIADAINNTNVTTLYDYVVNPGHVRVINKKSGDDEYTDFVFDSDTNRILEPVEGGTLIGDVVTNTNATTLYDYVVNPGEVRVITVKAGEDDEYTDYAFNATSRKIEKPLEGGTLIGDNVNNPSRNTTYDDSVAGKMTILNEDENTYTTYEYDNSEHTFGRILAQGTWSGSVGSPVLNPQVTYSYAGNIRIEIDVVNGTQRHYQIFPDREELIKYVAADGTETNLSNGLIQDIRDNVGSPIRTYNYSITPAAGEPTATRLDSINWTGKGSAQSITQNIDGRLSRKLYDSGVIENDIVWPTGEDDGNVTDALGVPEIVNRESDLTTIYFNTGVVQRFRLDPSDGAGEVLDQVINLKGRIQTMVYQQSDITPASPCWAYADTDAKGGADCAELNSGSGFIVYKKNGVGTLMDGPNGTGNEIIDFVVDWDGKVRRYHYDDDVPPAISVLIDPANADLDRVVEEESLTENRTASEIFYQNGGDQINYIFTYDNDGIKVLQRDEYFYDDAVMPHPDRVKQYDVSQEADPSIIGSGFLESTLTYRNSPIFPDENEPQIQTIENHKTGRISTYNYTIEGYVDYVEEHDALNILRSRTQYQKGVFFNDLVRQVVTYRDDPASGDPLVVLPNEQQVFDYDSVSGRLAKISTYDVFGATADDPGTSASPLAMVDDRLISEILFEDDLPQIEFRYGYDASAVRQDISYSITRYAPSSRKPAYLDEHKITGPAHMTAADIANYLVLNPSDTTQDAIDALLPTKTDYEHRNRTYFDADGNRAAYSVQINAAGRPVRLNVFTYDDGGDGDLRQIDEYDIVGDSNFATLPVSESVVVIPTDPTKLKSTVYFHENGERTEFSVTYRYVGITRYIDDYTIFSYAQDERTLIYTDGYDVQGASDITWALVQNEITTNAAVDTIREALVALLAGATDDFIGSRSFVNEDQEPVLSLSISRLGEVEEVSSFQVNPATRELAWVDTHMLTDQVVGPGIDLASFNPLVMISPAAVSGLYNAGLYRSRTFIEDGDPAMSLGINAAQDVTVVSTFKVDPLTSRTLWIDNHKMIDQNTAAGFQYMPFDPASTGTMTSRSQLEVSGIYELTTYDSRTFVDADGVARGSLSGDGRSLSKFNYDANLDLESIDQYEAEPRIPLTPSSPAAMPAVPGPGFTFTSRVYLNVLTGAALGSLSWDGKSLSVFNLEAGDEDEDGDRFESKSIDQFDVFPPLLPLAATWSTAWAAAGTFSSRVFLDYAASDEFQGTALGSLSWDGKSLSVFNLEGEAGIADDGDQNLKEVASIDQFDKSLAPAAMALTWNTTWVVAGEFTSRVFLDYTATNDFEGTALGSLSWDGKSLSVFNLEDAGTDDGDQNQKEVVSIDQYDMSTAPLSLAIGWNTSWLAPANFTSRVFLDYAATDEFEGTALGSLSWDGKSLSVFNLEGEAGIADDGDQNLHEVASIDQYDKSITPAALALTWNTTWVAASEFTSRVFLDYTATDDLEGTALGSLSWDGKSLSVFNLEGEPGIADDGDQNLHEVASIDQYDKSASPASFALTWNTAWVVAAEFTSRVFLDYTATDEFEGTALGSLSWDGKSLSVFNLEGEAGVPDDGDQNFKEVASIDQYDKSITPAALALMWNTTWVVAGEFTSRVFLDYTATNDLEGTALGSLSWDGKSLSVFNLEGEAGVPDDGDQNFHEVASIDQYDKSISPATMALVWNTAWPVAGQFTSRVFLNYTVTDKFEGTALGSLSWDGKSLSVFNLEGEAGIPDDGDQNSNEVASIDQYDKGTLPGVMAIAWNTSWVVPAEFTSRVFLDYTATDEFEGTALGSLSWDGKSLSVFNLEGEAGVSDDGDQNRKEVASIDQYDKSAVPVALALTWNTAWIVPAEFTSRVFLDYTVTGEFEGTALGSLSWDGKSLSVFNLEGEAGVPDDGDQNLHEVTSIDQFDKGALPAAMVLVWNTAWLVPAEFTSRVFLDYTATDGFEGTALGSLSWDGKGLSVFNLEGRAGIPDDGDQNFREVASIDQYDKASLPAVMALTWSTSWPVATEFSSRVFLDYAATDQFEGSALGSLSWDGKSLSVFNLEGEGAGGPDDGDQNKREVTSIDQYDKASTPAVMAALWNTGWEIAAEFTSRVFLDYTAANEFEGSALGSLSWDGKSLSVFNLEGELAGGPDDGDQNQREVTTIDQYDKATTPAVLATVWNTAWPVASEFTSRVFLDYTATDGFEGTALGSLSWDGKSLSVFNLEGEASGGPDDGDQNKREVTSIDQYDKAAAPAVMAAVWNTGWAVASDFTSRVFLDYTSSGAFEGTALGSLSWDGKSLSVFNLEGQPGGGPDDGDQNKREVTSIDQYDKAATTAGMAAVWNAGWTLAGEFTSRVFLDYAVTNEFEGTALGSLSWDGKSLSIFNLEGEAAGGPDDSDQNNREVTSIDQYDKSSSPAAMAAVWDTAWPVATEFSSRVFLDYAVSTEFEGTALGSLSWDGKSLSVFNLEGEPAGGPDDGDQNEREVTSIDQFDKAAAPAGMALIWNTGWMVPAEHTSRVFLAYAATDAFEGTALGSLSWDGKSLSVFNLEGQPAGGPDDGDQNKREVTSIDQYDKAAAPAAMAALWNTGWTATGEFTSRVFLDYAATDEFEGTALGSLSWDGRSLSVFNLEGEPAGAADDSDQNKREVTSIDQYDKASAPAAMAAVWNTGWEVAAEFGSRVFLNYGAANEFEGTALGSLTWDGKSLSVFNLEGQAAGGPDDGDQNKREVTSIDQYDKASAPASMAAAWNAGWAVAGEFTSRVFLDYARVDQFEGTAIGSLSWDGKSLSVFNLEGEAAGGPDDGDQNKREVTSIDQYDKAAVPAGMALSWNAGWAVATEFTSRVFLDYAATDQFEGSALGSLSWDGKSLSAFNLEGEAAGGPDDGDQNKREVTSIDQYDKATTPAGMALVWNTAWEVPSEFTSRVFLNYAVSDQFEGTALGSLSWDGKSLSIFNLEGGAGGGPDDGDQNKREVTSIDQYDKANAPGTMTAAWNAGWAVASEFTSRVFLDYARVDQFEGTAIGSLSWDGKSLSVFNLEGEAAGGSDDGDQNKREVTSIDQYDKASAPASLAAVWNTAWEVAVEFTSRVFLDYAVSDQFEGTALGSLSWDGKSISLFNLEGEAAGGPDDGDQNKREVTSIDQYDKSGTPAVMGLTWNTAWAVSAEFTSRVFLDYTASDAFEGTALGSLSWDGKSLSVFNLEGEAAGGPDDGDQNKREVTSIDQYDKATVPASMALVWNAGWAVATEFTSRVFLDYAVSDEFEGTALGSLSWDGKSLSVFNLEGEAGAGPDDGDQNKREVTSIDQYDKAAAPASMAAVWNTSWIVSVEFTSRVYLDYGASDQFEGTALGSLSWDGKSLSVFNLEGEGAGGPDDGDQNQREVTSIDQYDLSASPESAASATWSTGWLAAHAGDFSSRVFLSYAVTDEFEGSALGSLSWDGKSLSVFNLEGEAAGAPDDGDQNKREVTSIDQYDKAAAPAAMAAVWNAGWEVASEFTSRVFLDYAVSTEFEGAALGSLSWDGKSLSVFNLEGEAGAGPDDGDQNKREVTNIDQYDKAGAPAGMALTWSTAWVVPAEFTSRVFLDYTVASEFEGTALGSLSWDGKSLSVFNLEGEASGGPDDGDQNKREVTSIDQYDKAAVPVAMAAVWSTGWAVASEFSSRVFLDYAVSTEFEGTALGSLSWDGKSLSAFNLEGEAAGGPDDGDQNKREVTSIDQYDKAASPAAMALVWNAGWILAPEFSSRVFLNYAASDEFEGTALGSLSWDGKTLSVFNLEGAAGAGPDDGDQNKREVTSIDQYDKAAAPIGMASVWSTGWIVASEFTSRVFLDYAVSTQFEGTALGSLSWDGKSLSVFNLEGEAAGGPDDGDQNKREVTSIDQYDKASAPVAMAAVWNAGWEVGTEFTSRVFLDYAVSTQFEGTALGSLSWDGKSLSVF